MNSRFVFLAVLSALASSASASFELILALDKGNGSTQGRIHRYDGDTGTYLGSFAQGWVNSTSTMLINQAANTVYVNTGTSLRAFDYNTGELKRTFAYAQFSSMSVAPLGGAYVTYANSPTNMISRIDLSTATTLQNITLPTPSGGVLPRISTVIAKTGLMIAVDVANDRIFGSSDNGSTWSSTAFAGLSTIGNSEQGIASNNNWGDLYFTDAGSPNVKFWAGSIADLPVGISGATGTTGLALGHDAVAYCLYKTATGSGIVKYDRFQSQGFSFSTPQIVTPGYLASVVAPEPGSMLALGLGVAALLKRRRK